ncbi:MAG: hypothetical protein AABY15_07275 [Nanoarchaeota archaeon]
MEDYKIGQYNFSTDIITGEKGEEDVINFYSKKGYKLIATCNDKKFDLLLQGLNRSPLKIEVKTDSYKDTGNMAIEVESRGSASGLMVTEAEYFVTLFRFNNELWIIKTDDLKELITSNNFYLKTGGDQGSNTKFYLINKAKFKKHFQVHQLT